MSKKLNREIKCIDHLQGHNKRQGFSHYTDRDIRSNVLFAPNQCLGYLGNESLLDYIEKKNIWKFKNHKGAEDFPDSMLSLLGKESRYKAILGPFKNNPFSSGMKISPLNTVPKRESSERLIILDLSFPKGAAINDFVSKEFYLGEKIDLVYPKVDDFIQLIKQKGQGCLLFKTDLSRAYRQLSYCPSSFNLVAFIWKNIFSVIQL